MDEMGGAQWLDPVFSTPKTVEMMLQPFPPHLMEVYEVSVLLNDPRNDSPACIEPSGWPPSQARLISQFVTEEIVPATHFESIQAFNAGVVTLIFPIRTHSVI